MEMMEEPPSIVRFDIGGVPPCVDGNDGGHLSATLLASCLLLPSPIDSVGGGGEVLSCHLVTVLLCAVRCVDFGVGITAVLLVLKEGGLLAIPGLLHAEDGGLCLHVVLGVCLLLPGVSSLAVTC